MNPDSNGEEEGEGHDAYESAGDGAGVTYDSEMMFYDMNKINIPRNIDISVITLVAFARPH